MAQDQIQEMNQKLDLLLAHMNQQRMKTEMMNDLIADIAVIGKDAYQSSVEILQNQGIELDGEALQHFILKLMKNANNFSMILSMFESFVDLMKDMGPILKETGYDVIDKFHVLEQKGYFEFISEVFKILDNIVTHYSIDEVRMLADNAVTILDTIKNVTQPDMLRAINNGVQIFKDLDPNNVPEYSYGNL